MNISSNNLSSGCAVGLQSRMKSSRFRWYILIFCSLADLTSKAAAESVTLEWDANSEADLAGYKLHYGIASGAYTETVVAGNTTTATAANLNPGTTYYYVVTAYNTEGLESLPSNEVTYTTGTINRAPTAASQSVAAVEDQSSTVTLAGSDIDGNPLTFLIASAPAHGTLGGNAPGVLYTPAANYYGPDSFTFTVSDGTLVSSAATVTVTVASVNDAPAAEGQIAVTEEDTVAALNLAATDADGDAVTYSILQPPVHGTLSGSLPNPIYSPNPDFQGSDSFTFSASDGLLVSTPGVVSLAVTPVNDAPLAAGQSAATQEDVSAAITLTGSDVDGDVLSYAIINPPARGTLSGSPPALTYVPASNFHGNDSFTFTVTDGERVSAPAMVSVTVTPVDDPPVALDASITTTMETAVNVILQASSVDGETLSYSVLTNPSSGILSGTAPNLVYTPAPGFVGSVSFTFQASSGAAPSASALVLIQVVRPGIWEIVALSGDLAAGAGGDRFASFSPAVRSDGEGDAAFRGELNSVAGTAGGVWVEENGVPALIVRQGGPAPGVNGGLFDFFSTSPWWSGSGYLLLYSKLQIGSGAVSLSNDYGLWYKSPSDQLQLVARENGPAADLPAGANYLALGSNAALADNGKFAFTASLVTNSALAITSANDSGLWTNFSGPLTLLAREGATAAGTTNAAKFDAFTSAQVSASSSGQIAFTTMLKTTTGVTKANKYGLWMWDGSQLANIARGGDPAPGTPAGSVFVQPGAPLLRATMLLFYATLATTSGVTSSTDTGIWVLENGSISLIAREGFAATGAPRGAVFGTLPAALAGNDLGDIVFKASLRIASGVTSSNNDGIWARSPGTANVLTLIAREGSNAPQTPAGTVFTTFDTVVVSGGGQEAFTANLLAGPGGVSTSNDRGLWMRASSGQFLLLLREGDLLPITAGDIRTVSSIVLDKSSEFGAASFSSDVSIKVIVTFTNGTSAILSCKAP